MARHARQYGDPPPKSCNVGEMNPRCKLSEMQVREIKTRSRTETQISLARAYGVSAWTISKIVRGKSWKHL